MTPTFFATQEQFREWLENNHNSASELLVGFYKVGSGKPSLSWSQSVDQALCFGWIDGVRRSIDHEKYCIRFTPRKTSSIWSNINIKKVEELTKAGLMKPEGIKAFSFRTDNRSGVYSHDKEPVPLDKGFEKQFRKNKPAWEFFSRQAPSYRKVMIHWIMGAKQEITRQSRLDKTIKASGELKGVI